jgi:hypothetical protein
MPHLPGSDRDALLFLHLYASDTSLILQSLNCLKTVRQHDWNDEVGIQTHNRPVPKCSYVMSLSPCLHHLLQMSTATCMDTLLARVPCQPDQTPQPFRRCSTSATMTLSKFQVEADMVVRLQSVEGMPGTSPSLWHTVV